NAKLSPLANNGGPTRTMALLADSPAINAGSNARAVNPSNSQALTTDQRGGGFTRILGGTVDMGAFEAPEINGNALAFSAFSQESGPVGGTQKPSSVTLLTDDGFLAESPQTLLDGVFSNLGQWPTPWTL
ncbi:MAG: choice-of-anchor Q domain-containing protein, partial [Planctomycetales bacterium]